MRYYRRNGLLHISALLTNAGLTAVVMAVCVSSCSHKELDRNGSAELQVSFDWRQTNGAMSPMLLAVFSPSTSPVVQTFASSQGGTIVLPAMKDYQFIGYSDTENLTTRGDTWDNYELCSKTTALELFSPLFSHTHRAPRALGTEDQAVIEEADRVCTAASNTTTLTFGYDAMDMTMQEATQTYTFIIKGVENLSYVTGITASISGMSASWYPSRQRCADTHCIIAFTMESLDATTLIGTVRTFGHCPLETQSEHMLVLYMELNDNSKWYYTFDVTETIHDKSLAADDSETLITLNGLPIPKPITNSSGLQPELDEWNEVVIDYPLL